MAESKVGQEELSLADLLSQEPPEVVPTNSATLHLTFTGVTLT